MYEIKYLKSFYKNYKKINNNDKKSIESINHKIREICNNPYLTPYKKLVGYDNYLRYRIGKYRLIIEIKNNLIIIRNIKQRKDVYKKL